MSFWQSTSPPTGLSPLSVLLLLALLAALSFTGLSCYYGAFPPQRIGPRFARFDEDNIRATSSRQTSRGACDHSGPCSPTPPSRRVVNPRGTLSRRVPVRPRIPLDPSLRQYDDRPGQGIQEIWNSPDAEMGFLPNRHTSLRGGGRPVDVPRHIIDPEGNEGAVPRPGLLGGGSRMAAVDDPMAGHFPLQIPSETHGMPADGIHLGPAQFPFQPWRSAGAHPSELARHPPFPYYPRAPSSTGSDHYFYHTIPSPRAPSPALDPSAVPQLPPRPNYWYHPVHGMFEWDGLAWRHNPLLGHPAEAAFLEELATTHPRYQLGDASLGHAIAVADWNHRRIVTDAMLSTSHALAAAHPQSFPRWRPEAARAAAGGAAGPSATEDVQMSGVSAESVGRGDESEAVPHDGSSPADVEMAGMGTEAKSTTQMQSAAEQQWMEALVNKIGEYMDARETRMTSRGLAERDARRSGREEAGQSGVKTKRNRSPGDNGGLGESGYGRGERESSPLLGRSKMDQDRDFGDGKGKKVEFAPSPVVRTGRG
jgi:hypothetical protein